MSYRLGAYECPQCGQIDTVAIEQQPDTQSQRPGVRSTSQFGLAPQRSVHSAPPQAPPPQGTLHGGTGDLYGDAHGFAAPQSGDDPLRLEKHIYFGLAIAGTLLNVVPAVSSSVSNPYMSNSDFGTGGEVAIQLIGGIIGLLLLWWALYGKTIWAKWCCIVSELVYALVIVLGVFFVSALISQFIGADIQPGMGGILTAVMVIFMLLAASIILWLVSILYRDIQRLKGNY